MMENAFVRRRKIKDVLSIYSGFLSELAVTLKGRYKTIDIKLVEAHAFRVLEENLTERELSAILEIEGNMSDRLPGLRNRINQLFRKEIAFSLLQDDL